MRRALPALLLLAAACSSSPNLPPEWELGGQTRGYHDGPTVAAGIQATFVPAETLLANWSAATVPGSVASSRAGDDALADAVRETRIDELPGVSFERFDGGLRVIVRGAERAHEAVAVVVPRDADASAGLLEAVRAFALALETQALRAPRRTLVLMWAAPRDLAREVTALDPIALFVGDSLGLPEEAHGAVATLVRGVDPGYYAPMPPDRAAAPLDEDGPAPAVAPHGASLVARLALVDVGIVARPWESREQQWGALRDGLSDLAVPSARLTRIPADALAPVEAGVPAVDGEALRRTSCALLAAGIAVADAGPQDLDRYLKTLAFERRLRVNSAAMEGAEHAVITEWEAWCTGTRHWLRRLCMGLPLDGSGD